MVARGAEDGIDACVRVTEKDTSAATLWSVFIEPELNVTAKKPTRFPTPEQVVEALAAATPEGDPLDERNPRDEVARLREELKKERAEIARLRDALARAREGMRQFLVTHGPHLDESWIRHVEVHVGIERDACGFYKAKPVD